MWMLHLLKCRLFGVRCTKCYSGDILVEYTLPILTCFKQYRVIYQAPPNQRANVESFDVMKVRSSTGAMAPVSRFVTLKRVYGPQSISRFNLFTAVTVNGTPNPGYSSGDAIQAVQEVAAQVIPSGYGYEFSGLTREEMSAVARRLSSLHYVVSSYTSFCAVRKLYASVCRNVFITIRSLQVHYSLPGLPEHRITFILRFP